MPLKVSTGLTGKLKSINALSVSSFNPVCDDRVDLATPASVCGHCYARRYERIRPSVRKVYEENLEILSRWLLQSKDIPEITPRVYGGRQMPFRFNAFGEVVNETHWRNLVEICKFYPWITFGLWSKNLKFEWIARTPKLENMILVYSSPVIGQPVNFGEPNPFDHVFTVYPKGAKIPDDAFPCGNSCRDCLVCYMPSDNLVPYHVAEILK